MEIEKQLSKEGIENELIIMNSLGRSSSVYHKELADKFNPTLIILGYNKEKLLDRLIGSTSENVIKYANCSVLVVK